MPDNNGLMAGKTVLITGAASGLGAAAATIPPWQALIPLLLWPFVALGLATAAFRRVTP